MKWGQGWWVEDEYGPFGIELSPTIEIDNPDDSLISVNEKDLVDMLEALRAKKRYPIALFTPEQAVQLSPINRKMYAAYLPVVEENDDE